MEGNPYSSPQGSEHTPGSHATAVGLASVLLALAGSGLFLIIALNARIVSINRLNREAHWDEPVATWVVPLEILGWVLMAAAAVLGLGSQKKLDHGKAAISDLGACGLFLVMLNVGGHCFFFMALAES